MTTAKRWRVDIRIQEHPDRGRTRAQARLHTDDRIHLIGIGGAARAPDDRDVPEVGDELAVARALADLARRLHAVAAADVEALAADALSRSR